MGKDMEKIYNNIYKDNDKYSDIYGIRASQRDKAPPDNRRCPPDDPRERKKVASVED